MACERARLVGRSGCVPFCTRSWAAVVFFLVPPACAASSCCCFCFWYGSAAFLDSHTAPIQTKCPLECPFHCVPHAYIVSPPNLTPAPALKKHRPTHHRPDLQHLGRVYITLPLSIKQRDRKCSKLFRKIECPFHVCLLCSVDGDDLDLQQLGIKTLRRFCSSVRVVCKPGGFLRALAEKLRVGWGEDPNRGRVGRGWRERGMATAGGAVDKCLDASGERVKNHLRMVISFGRGCECGLRSKCKSNTS